MRRARTDGSPTRASRLRRLALLLAAGLAVWLVSSLVVVDRLTRRARAPFEEPPPSVAWAEITSQRLSTSDGESIGAWWIEAPGTGLDGPGVVLLHGNGGSRRSRLSHAELLVSAGCTVLAVSARAHGDSTGERNDLGWSARHDVVAAVELLESRRPGSPILVCGASLGAAAAVFAAEELGDRVAGYVLECPYRDLLTAAHNRVRLRLPSPLDWLAVQGMRLTAPLVVTDLERISPLARAAGMPRSSPVLIIAGGLDRRATPEEAEELRAAIGSQARLVVLEGADHGRLLEMDPVGYAAALRGFVDSLRGGGDS